MINPAEDNTINNEINLKDSERQRCEVWTRVMGYHRPVSEFNPGKQSEHNERKHFLENTCSLNNNDENKAITDG
ncbi:MAG: hypothetical protein KBD25_00270 [Rickettsiaceae bacterium]|nr:hypothetical protein [Rickettsiaceae bacterium]